MAQFFLWVRNKKCARCHVLDKYVFIKKQTIHRFTMVMRKKKLYNSFMFYFGGFVL